MGLGVGRSGKREGPTCNSRKVGCGEGMVTMLHCKVRRIEFPAGFCSS